MTLFTLLNHLRARTTRPVWDLATDVEVTLVHVESEGVLVRLKGHKDLGRVLQGNPRPVPKSAT